ARSESADSPADPLHHRQRRMRAVQLLWDAQHPDGVPRHVAADVFAGSGAGERGEGCLSYLRRRRLFFPAAWWLDRGPVLWKIQHHLLAQPGLLRRATLPGIVRDE